MKTAHKCSSAVLPSETVDDSRALRRFVGIGPTQRVPDATTLLKFRRLLEKHGLTVKNLFGFRKTRYKDIAKNKSCPFLLFACANLLIAERKGFFHTA